MRGKKTLMAGLAAGILLSMTVQAFGTPLVRLVEARINPDYHITFDGEKKDMPDGYDILVYKDRTYVPARYVAEELGATVKWHEDTKEIEIVRPQVPTGPCVEQPGEEPSKDNYNEFPVAKETEDYRLSAFMYTKDSNTGDQRLWFRLKNKGDSPIQLDQAATIIEESNKTYGMDMRQAADFDKRWYNDIAKDDTVEGYVLLPDAIRQPKYLKIQMTVVVRDQSGNKAENETVKFNIAL